MIQHEAARRGHLTPRAPHRPERERRPAPGAVKRLPIGTALPAPVAAQVIGTASSSPRGGFVPGVGVKRFPLGPMPAVPVAPFGPVPAAGAVNAVARMPVHEFQQLEGLGFSLKPPSWLKKAATAVKKAVTIKNVAIAVGAVVAAPFVLPAAAAVGGAVLHAATAGAGLLARGAIGAGKFVGSEVASLLPHKMPAQPAAVLTDPGTGIAIPSGTTPAGLATSNYPASGNQAGTPMPQTAGGGYTQPDTSGGGYSSPAGGGGGGYTAPATPATDAGDTSVQTAGPGPGSMIVPLLIGGVALLVLSRRSKLRRA